MILFYVHLDSATQRQLSRPGLERFCGRLLDACRHRAAAENREARAQTSGARHPRRSQEAQSLPEATEDIEARAEATVTRTRKAHANGTQDRAPWSGAAATKACPQYASTISLVFLDHDVVKGLSN